MRQSTPRLNITRVNVSELEASLDLMRDAGSHTVPVPLKLMRAIIDALKTGRE